jgi:hypothetical protein
VKTTRVTICQPSRLHRIERQAGAELMRYGQRLFGWRPRRSSAMPRSGVVFRLCVRSTDLGRQAYTIERARREGCVTVCDLAGGSPLALQWAVYDLVQQWGVYYLLGGDVFPEKPRPMRLPKQTIVREPQFATRYFRIVNDLANSTVFWSRAEHEQLFDQLVKLRYNGVLISTYPHQPWCNWTYRGVKRTDADLDYGWTYPIHERSVGVDELGGAGRFTNPDFRDCRDYRDRIDAGTRFMHGLIDAAHARGLQCEMHHILTNAPAQIKNHLGEWSKAVRLPRSEMGSCHAHSLGIAKDDGNARFGHLMTPLNPAYVDMIESWLGAMLREYPQIDALSLGQSEFPPSAGGIRKCWQQLDRRHGLRKHFDLDAIFDKASKETFMSPGRALREAQGAVATIRLLDLVINEHRVVDRYLGSDAPITCHFMSEFLQPVVPHVFDPARVGFAALVDYLPATVAKRMDAMAYVRDSPMRARMIATVEDDNVGFLPQANGPSLHRIVRKMRQHGLAGFSLRHWLISKHEPALAYMAESAWDKHATHESVLRRQVDRVCGPKAVEPMVAALRRIQRTGELVDATIPLGFLTPGLLKRVWDDPGAQPKPQWEKLVRVYTAVLALLDEADAVTAPRGKRYIASWIGYVGFARRYLQTAQYVCRARQARAQADALASKGRAAVIDAYDRALTDAADHMAQAAVLMEQAVKCWRDGLCDPSDRGVLAGINVWGLDYVRAKADELRQDAEYWGLQI